MTETTQFDPEAEAQRLVGKFLQSFALLGQALDAGIGKLLGLEGGRNDIVCSSIPLAKKVDVFFSAEGLLATLPDAKRKKLLKDMQGRIKGLNEPHRVTFANNPFSASEQDGVRFRRVVAKGELKVSTEVYTSTRVKELCVEAEALSKQFVQLVAEMIPYAPSLDFSDPRNSGYLVML